MIEDKIFENSFDKVDYGVERTTQASIQISPFVEKQYEESVSENIDDLYTRRRLMRIMYDLYIDSEFFEKETKERDWNIWGADAKDTEYNQSMMPLRKQKDDLQNGRKYLQKMSPTRS